ncbi:MAG: IscS subfamily cysteine desulfurase [Bacteroidota bacterium]
MIYLDHNATTPCAPEVVEAMLPWFTEKFGNAASRNHPMGWEAEEAVDQARQQLANLLQVDTRELVFTSGSTEAINLALKGIYERYYQKGNHIITVKTEHKAVLDTCERIEKMGGEVTYLDVDKSGLIDIEELEAAITEKTILVAVMYANNETGVIQPMQAIGDICAQKNVLFFSDATQTIGKVKTHPKTINLSMLSFTAHKMYGPKGIGALFVSQRSPRIKLAAQIDGGGHEGDMRSGTLNVPAIVGFGKAAAVAQNQMEADAEKLETLRDYFEAQLLTHISYIHINGKDAPRMPHVSNVAFEYTKSETLIKSFNRHIAVSSGSACSSATLEPSHVLLAMGLDKELADASVRFSLGRSTTKEQIDITIKEVIAAVEKLRAVNPVWEMFQQGIL